MDALPPDEVSAGDAAGRSAPLPPCPHLGNLRPDILGHIVAAALSEEVADGSEEEECSELMRSLRLCCRTLRQLVDDATTSWRVWVNCEWATEKAAPEDCSKLLGRLRNLRTVRIAPYEAPTAYGDEEDEALNGLVDGAVQRVLQTGLPRALPEGGMHRITGLELGRDGLRLARAVATAIGATLPRLQRLECSLPPHDSWAGRLGTAVLYDLPPTLQHLDLGAGAVGPDCGKALSCLAALTSLRLTAAGMRNSICRHVAALSSLRSLHLSPWCSSADDVAEFEASYNAADVGALSALVHLTHLQLGGPFVGEHLPLAHLAALESLRVRVTSVDAFGDALAAAGLEHLQQLDLSPGRLATAATATDTTPGTLLPLSLTELRCCLLLDSPRQVASVHRLLLRLSMGSLRCLRLQNGALSPYDKDCSAAHTLRHVVLPLMTSALARFTAVETLQWSFHCGALSYFSLRSPLMTQQGQAPHGGTLADVVRAMPHLRDVDISADEVGGNMAAERRAQRRQPEGGGRAWLTDEALEALASQPGSQLRCFRLRDAAHVTAAGVRGLLQLPRLRKIQIYNCPQVPPSEFEALRQACPASVDLDAR